MILLAEISFLFVANLFVNSLIKLQCLQDQETFSPIMVVQILIENSHQNDN